MSEAVLFEKKDGVATVTLNRPDRLNAVNDEIRAGLKEKLDDACKDDEVKVIILLEPVEVSVQVQIWMD